MFEIWVQRKGILAWGTIKTFHPHNLDKAIEFKKACEKQTDDKIRILKVEVVE